MKINPVRLGMGGVLWIMSVWWAYLYSVTLPADGADMRLITVLLYCFGTLIIALAFERRK